VARVEQAARAIESPASAPTDEEADRVNAALLRASHLLNATLYSGAGRFHQDPAYPQPLLPGLAGLRELRTLDPKSDRYGFWSPRSFAGETAPMRHCVKRRWPSSVRDRPHHGATQAPPGPQ
jgi:hypothetical protein